MQAAGTIRRFGDLNSLPVKDRQGFLTCRDSSLEEALLAPK